VTITTGLVDTFSILMLLKTVQSKRIDAAQLITHRFKLTDILQAYDTFGKAADTKALKVIIEPHDRVDHIQPGQSRSMDPPA